MGCTPSKPTTTTPTHTRTHHTSSFCKSQFPPPTWSSLCVQNTAVAPAAAHTQSLSPTSIKQLQSQTKLHTQHNCTDTTHTLPPESSSSLQLHPPHPPSPPHAPLNLLPASPSCLLLDDITTSPPPVSSSSALSTSTRSKLAWSFFKRPPPIPLIPPLPSSPSECSAQPPTPHAPSSPNVSTTSVPPQALPTHTAPHRHTHPHTTSSLSQTTLDQRLLPHRNSTATWVGGGEGSLWSAASSRVVGWLGSLGGGSRGGGERISRPTGSGSRAGGTENRRGGSASVGASSGGSGTHSSVPSLQAITVSNEQLTNVSADSINQTLPLSTNVNHITPSRGSSSSSSSTSFTCAAPTTRSCSTLLDRFSKASILHSRIQRGVCVTDLYTFEPGAVLGTGISGTVRVGQHKQTGVQFAVKSLNVVNLNPRKATLLYNEVSIYLSLDHPNIAKLFEVYEDDKAIHLIMELCTGKELYDRLASKKRYHERDAVKVTRQMLAAINYCHKHRICHRDLKLENWVYATMADDAALKLIDFGFSRIFNPGVPMTAMHGTVYYVSPEVMDGCYGEKCDIWSIGVIVFMLLSGSPPFNGGSDHETLVKIKRAAFSFQGQRWLGISEDARHFISQLLLKNPEARLSAEAALQHRWLNPTTDIKDTEIDTAVLKSMLRFAASSAMKRAALGVIAYSMRTEDMECLEEEFRKIDKTGSGTIRLDHLVSILTTSLNITEEQAHTIFQKMSQTRDQEVHYSEFLASTMMAKVALDEPIIRAAFQKFDVDNSGFISLTNLRQVLGDEYDGKAVGDILNTCSSHGMLNYDDFLNTLCSDDVMDVEDWTSSATVPSISKSLLAMSEGDDGAKIPAMTPTARFRLKQ
eukprot:GHVQ01030294.1.p1 GENE.GHVQ01030294.1~~GHVQ01030294.1.p1  ORF type:complete len:864 (-),score=164.49 GHVQ01030294.1:233-2824(-)